MRRAVPCSWFTAACRAARRSLRAWVCLLALAVALPAPAADRITLADVSFALAADGDGAAINAQFDFALPRALEDAVNRGIALYFVVDFEMYRSRWYWFDRKVADQALTYRLTYSPLTRQYRLARGALAQPFDSLAEALATLKRVRGWKVLERSGLPTGDDPNAYRAQLRLRLDTSQLPKPFQVDALTNRDWVLTSDWQPLRPAPELFR